MIKRLPSMSQLQKLGWITVLAFTVKGCVTTALIVWALLNAPV